MITAYTANTPNGVKVPIALEVLGLSRGSDYQLKILDLKAREQKEPEFLKVNPSHQCELQKCQRILRNPALGYDSSGAGAIV